MSAEVLGALPQWRRTGHTFFPYAAFVDGRWWVLRFNCFPDHPLWTLFIADRRRFDFDDEPTGWGIRMADEAPLLEGHAAAEVLAPVQGLARYGSEVGDPCDDFLCPCAWRE